MNKNNNGPVVTVVVPVYNVEAELNRCVESLVGQTFSDLQIILVDDGSTDLSGELCDAWADRDSRICVIHKQNGGLSSARNAGIDIAEGEYLGFVDSDDFIEPDMYETLLAGMVDGEVSMVTCGRYVHMGDTVRNEFSTPVVMRLTSADAMKEALLGNIIDVSAWDKLYRRELFDEIRYPYGRISEDASIILQLLDRCSDVVHVGKCLYHYVFRTGSISKSTYSHKQFDVMYNCREMTAWVEKNKPDFSMDINSYCCAQMAGMIECMICSPGARKEWGEDYSAYWGLFRHCFQSYVTLGGHKKVEIARVFATRMHLYRLFWLARQVRNGVKRYV